MLPAGLGAGKRPKALICISPPATWWWVEGTLRTRGGGGRLALGKAHFGNEMAFGNDSRIEISFPSH